jgi:predicted dehydrogenase
MQHNRFTRRYFLKAAAVATAAAGFPQVIPQRAFGAGNRLNVALFGAGNRMRQILPSIIEGGTNVVAMCDVDPEQIVMTKGGSQAKIGITAGGAKAAAAKEPPPRSAVAAALAKTGVYEDYRRILDAEKSVDAVIIACGQRWHAHMSKTALSAGKHVFCEKPLCHSVDEARMLRDLGMQTKLVTEVGSQGGTSDTFRRSMELIQAGLLGQIHDVHSWSNRGFPPSAAIDMNPDPMPPGLNWDFWCGPCAMLPYKNYYLRGCLAWGRWFEYGDGHLADMGSHGLNLPWRALKLGQPIKASVTSAEPAKDAYPSANSFRWDFAAREKFDAVSVWWHDGDQATAPREYHSEILSTYTQVPGTGVLFIGEKGMLLSDAWGKGGVVKLKGERKFRGVLDHEAGKDIPVTLPRMKGQNHMEEFLEACRGNCQTFQPFSSAAEIAEIAMLGIVALRLGRAIEWDSAAMQVKGAPEADRLVHREHRNKWL